MDDASQPTIADQLRAAVESHIESGASQYSLAKAAGVDPIHLSRWRRREKEITLPVAARLASVLGLDLAAPEKPAKFPRKTRGK